jgi:hypothetical protein
MPWQHRALTFRIACFWVFPECGLSRLQKAQHSSARLLTRTNRREHITPVLKELHWLPVGQRMDYKVFLVVHNVLHQETSPNYLREILGLHRPARRHRSSDDPWLLAIPRSNGAYGERSLGVLACRLWNSLSENIRCLKHKETALKKNILNNVLIGFYNLSSCFIRYKVLRKCFTIVLAL